MTETVTEMRERAARLAAALGRSKIEGDPPDYARRALRMELTLVQKRIRSALEGAEA